MRLTVKSAEGTALEKAAKEFSKQAAWLGKEVFQLWDDALDFYVEAAGIQDDSSEAFQKQERLLRAAVLGSAAAFEAWTNFLAEKWIESAQSLSEVERNILEEKKAYLRNGEIRKCKQNYNPRERFLLLYRLANGGAVPDQKTLEGLDFAISIRNQLTHPKPGSALRLSDEDKGVKAVHGFLIAEFMLAAVLSKHRALFDGTSLVN